MISIDLESSPIRRALQAARYTLIGALVLALAAPPASPQGPAQPASEAELGAPDGPKKHRRRQRRPIQMGTSGGNVNDFTIALPFIFCCSGTLGSLVRKGDRLFVLSNNHVIAMTNQGTVGDDINQPGLLDNKCDAPAKDFVAELSGWKRIKLDRGRNQVDAAIAEVLDGAVDESGAIIGIGVPGNAAVAPEVGLEVQKAGRTTGVRTGVIDSVNATVNVQYTEDCSENPTIRIGLFVKQLIVVSNTRKPFSAGGDSGSLVVEDVKTCPRQVGLLFAGNERLSVVSRMSTVLKQLKKMKPKGPASLVGCDPTSTGGAGEVKIQGGRGPDARQLRLAERIQARSERAILGIEGVHGMGIGRSSSEPGTAVFKVWVDDPRAQSAGRIPRSIEGIAVELVQSGPLRALACRPAGSDVASTDAAFGAPS